MIIGNGLMASGFKKSNINYDNFIIFCSGVSNSKETDENSFNREKQLLLKTVSENSKLKLIYFSSILAGVSNERYYLHKLEMENIIKNITNNYIIFRVPQIIGRNGNKNNLFSFLKDSILYNREITIFENTKRALIDINDLVKIVIFCKDKIQSEIINVSYFEKVDTLDLVILMSKILNKETKIKKVNNCYSNWNIENSKIIDDFIIYSKLEINDYTNKIVKKYIN